jgi:hypothetical protein
LRWSWFTTARHAIFAAHAVIDIPSGCCFPARGFFVVGGRASPLLLLGRTNFLDGIGAVWCGSRGGDDVSGG